MANTRLFLDERRTKKGSKSVLKIAIAHQAQTAYISVKVKLLPNQWDSKKLKVVNHPNQMLLNAHISSVKQQVDTILLSLANEGRISSMSASEIKAYIEVKIDPAKAKQEEESILFATRFLKFAESKKESTREVYMHTYSRMVAFTEEEGMRLDALHFEDITKEWLMKFDVFLSRTSPSKNARNIHLRNIRAVFNEAIDDEITIFYPFRRFKIRPVATAKRNLKVEELRQLFTYPCEAHAAKYLDMFKLMFMLIGINSIDLAHLKEVKDGRVEFHRSKTNRWYSIKVEPEAMEIIKRYRGQNWLVDILDHWRNHKDYTLKLNSVLKRIGEVKRVGLGGKKIYKPLFPNISTYWARHSWATIAASLDIPKDTIAHALGHGNNTVTDIYIDFDQKKVDEANRRVLDWVFYNKR